MFLWKSASLSFPRMRESSYLNLLWLHLKKSEFFLPSFSCEYFRFAPFDGMSFHQAKISFTPVFLKCQWKRWELYLARECFLMEGFLMYFRIACRRQKISMMRENSRSSCFLEIILQRTIMKWKRWVASLSDKVCRQKISCLIMLVLIRMTRCIEHEIFSE